jgi:hypothetical protein
VNLNIFNPATRIKNGLIAPQKCIRIFELFNGQGRNMFLGKKEAIAN